MTDKLIIAIVWIFAMLLSAPALSAMTTTEFFDLPPPLMHCIVAPTVVAVEPESNGTDVETIITRYLWDENHVTESEPMTLVADSGAGVLATQAREGPIFPYQLE